MLGTVILDRLGLKIAARSREVKTFYGAHIIGPYILLGSLVNAETLVSYCPGPGKRFVPRGLFDSLGLSFAKLI
jgi:hypothetical protein